MQTERGSDEVIDRHTHRGEVAREVCRVQAKKGQSMYVNCNKYTFAKFTQSTINVCSSVCPSVRLSVCYDGYLCCSLN